MMDVEKGAIPSGEKEVEELTNELIFTARCGTHTEVAKYLYNKGYRKQSEGEWATKDLNNPLYESKKAPHCSNCEYMSFIRYDYCPNCGAKMKGGETDA